MHIHHEPVAQLLRSVAREIILPRFRCLADHDISEKTPGEVVTIADREAEVALEHGLRQIDSSARIVGEEACASDPSALGALGRGRTWIVDPIDGTANFASGRAPFGIIIALAQEEFVEAGWLYDPLTERICHATLDGGAFVNGKRVIAQNTGEERPVVALATGYMDQEESTRLKTRAERDFQLVPIPRCAAEHYPRLVLGMNDVAVFRRTLPWDHAAGVLFLEEAGGHAARLDGTPYRINDGCTGLLAAASPALWDQAAAALIG